MLFLTALCFPSTAPRKSNLRLPQFNGIAARPATLSMISSIKLNVDFSHGYSFFYAYEIRTAHALRL